MKCPWNDFNCPHVDTSGENKILECSDCEFKNEHQLYGYDIDGVCSKEIEKKQPYVVISGRTASEWNDGGLYTELARNSPIFIRYKGRAGDRDDAGNFKAMMINYLGVTIFYEDEEYQAKIIRKQCPNCKVIIHT